MYQRKYREEVSELMKSYGELGHGITLLQYTVDGTQASISA